MERWIVCIGVVVGITLCGCGAVNFKDPAANSENAAIIEFSPYCKLVSFDGKSAKGHTSNWTATVSEGTHTFVYNYNNGSKSADNVRFTYTFLAKHHYGLDTTIVVTDRGKNIRNNVINAVGFIGGMFVDGLDDIAEGINTIAGDSGLSLFQNVLDYTVMETELAGFNYNWTGFGNANQINTDNLFRKISKDFGLTEKSPQIQNQSISDFVSQYPDAAIMISYKDNTGKRYLECWANNTYVYTMTGNSETRYIDTRYIIEDVNMRAGPSTQYTIVTVLLAETQVEVIDEKSSAPWVKISYNGNTGYVKSSYLKK
jgi:hypothetical protein